MKTLYLSSMLVNRTGWMSGVNCDALPGRSCDFPDTLARLALWPKFSVVEVEAPCEKEMGLATILPFPINKHSYTVHVKTLKCTLF